VHQVDAVRCGGVQSGARFGAAGDARPQRGGDPVRVDGRGQQPVPQLSNIAVAAAATRACLHDLNVSLADTGTYAGLDQVAGVVGGSESAEYLAQQWDPAMLPEPLDPADLAEAAWTLYAKRDRFETTIGL